MDPVHYRGSMGPVHRSGPGTQSKMGGPCFVLTSWGSRVLITIPRKTGSPFSEARHSQNMSNNAS